MEDIDLKKEFGKKIRKARGKKIKQKDFAEKAGIHKDQYSRYERGITRPGDEALKKIAQAANVPVDFILREESEWDMGEHKEGLDPALLIREMKEEYKTLPIERKKIIDNVREIIESDNEWMIHALMATTEGILEAIHTKKPNKGGQ